MADHVACWSVILTDHVRDIMLSTAVDVILVLFFNRLPVSKIEEVAGEKLAMYFAWP